MFWDHDVEFCFFVILPVFAIILVFTLNREPKVAEQRCKDGLLYHVVHEGDYSQREVLIPIYVEGKNGNTIQMMCQK